MKNGKLLLICLFSMLTVLGIVIVNGLFDNDMIGTSKKNNVVTTARSSKTTSKTTSVKVIEIKGEVYYPGVYQFYKDEVLIMDVINEAGGLTPRADVSLLNQASIVENHSSIFVGAVDSVSYILLEGEEYSKININSCSAEDLEVLSGIGPARAKAIINYRKKNGFFKSIDEIKNISEIGDAIFEAIKEYITV